MFPIISRVQTVHMVLIQGAPGPSVSTTCFMSKLFSLTVRRWSQMASTRIRPINKNALNPLLESFHLQRIFIALLRITIMMK